MWAKLLIPALTCLSFARGQSECTTPDGQIGVCKRIDTCEPLYKLIHEAVVVHEENMNHLRKSGCGFDQNTGIPKVCCPSCLTHEIKSVPGKCTDILKCEHIRKELTTPPVSQQFKVYVNSLRCQGKANFNVCCDPPSSEFVARMAPTQAPTTEHVAPTTVGPQTAYERASIPGLQQGQAMPGNGNTATCAMGAQPPDPAGNCCGHCGSSTRIFGGNETNIDEYPWLALIEYQKEDKIKLLCGGALISGRYVLTAGHCVVGLVLSAGTPKNVRLGEYDTANEGKDCVELDGGEEGEEDCTLEPVIIPIEQIIPHPDYNPRHLLRRNDIALLRLASIPEYTPFVRPICLPTTDITANSLQPKSLFVAGWGAVSDRISFSQVKLHVMLPLKPLEVCQQSYRSPGRRINLWDHQVCAGGELGKDSCKGDSGGPLMYNNGNHYELTGIVSFGPIPCGLEDVPGVYTKVFEYLTWIRNNIKP